MDLKHIYLLHHSHYDRGYTHSQMVVDQLQVDFIDQALDLLDATADWDAPSQPCWTIEVHQQLKLWLASATPEKIARLKYHVAQQRLGLGAIQFNSTPLSSIESLCKQLADVRRYRDELGFAVKVAFQHDVTGLPWVMSDLLLDAGVELLIMGVNLHTSDNGPVRPGMFNWRTPRGRNLKVFSGHQYCTFDSIAKPHVQGVEAMKAAMDAYWEFHQQRDYPYDFLYLTSTNLPIAYDNGGPSLPTAAKVRAWNRCEGYPTIEYVTPEQLLAKLERVPEAALETHRGDWSDFWSYGVGSAAHETALNANSKQKLFGAGLLGLHLAEQPRLRALQADAWEQVVSFDEHTWGYWGSASAPEHPHSRSLELKKRCMAHDGQELARYVLASRLSDYAGNPLMFESEGLLAVNPSPLPQAVTLELPSGWRDAVFGRLNGFSYAHSEPSTPVGVDDFAASQPSGSSLQVEMPPFSSVRVPWTACAAPEAADSLREDSVQTAFAVQALDGDKQAIRMEGNLVIESDYHLLEYCPVNGRIQRLYDKRSGWEVLPEAADYDLFEPIHEKPDPRFNPTRKSYYDRSVEAELRMETTGWNDHWRAQRAGVQHCSSVRVEHTARTISLVREYRLEGAAKIIQKFELCADRPWIEVDIVVHKDKVATPEAIYFVSQLNLAADWQAVYDASGMPARLDDEQLDRSSNGWVVAEAFSGMTDGAHQFTVCAPGMPLVQFGDFNFGKPKAAIPRNAAPLLLNWACNNYWETNFPVTQEGVIRYNCALYTSKGASDAELYRIADGFARKPLFLPLASCTEATSASLIQVDNPQVRLVSIDPGADDTGLVCRLANYSDAAQACRLNLMRACVSAAIVSPCGDVLRACEPQGGALDLEVPARGVLSVALQMVES